MKLDELHGGELSLVPVTVEVAGSAITGDLSGLEPGDGWPHEDTLDGLAITVKYRQPLGWLVIVNDCVIGDCGLHGPPDDRGSAEIGYGLAAPYRGRGLGSQMVALMTDWLLRQSSISSVVANTAASNWPSRRVLEKAGFHQTEGTGDGARYERHR